LTWEIFTEAWYRSVRRVVLGDGARDDEALTTMLNRLRGRANWVYALIHRRLRWRFHARLTEHLARGEPESLAAAILQRGSNLENPSDQVTQWLFAFDAGGISTWRALALLLTHSQQHSGALTKAAAGAEDAERPFLRACFLEAVRLWPTTPVILRETTHEVALASALLPKGASAIIYTPFFHRDSERLDHSDRFRPDLFLGKDPAAVPPFVPFSAGPAACPGRHLVSLVASAWLAALLRTPLQLLDADKLDPGKPLPGTLDHVALRFRISAQP
jgi:cytochrome P450